MSDDGQKEEKSVILPAGRGGRVEKRLACQADPRQAWAKQLDEESRDAPPEPLHVPNSSIPSMRVSTSSSTPFGD